MQRLHCAWGQFASRHRIHPEEQRMKRLAHYNNNEHSVLQTTSSRDYSAWPAYLAFAPYSTRIVSMYCHTSNKLPPHTQQRVSPRLGYCPNQVSRIVHPHGARRNR